MPFELSLLKKGQTYLAPLSVGGGLSGRKHLTYMSTQLPPIQLSRCTLMSALYGGNGCVCVYVCMRAFVN